MLETVQSHVLRITAGDSRAALHAADRVVSATGADLCRLSVKSVGDIVEAVLELRGLAETAARGLADQAADCVGVRSVRVEHGWGRF